MITQEEVKELVEYDPETGIFTWRVNRGGTARAGTEAGFWDKEGYRQIALYSKLYRAHRLAWLYMTGNWPADCIDHIDLNRGNNAFSNLRECTPSENKQNIRLNKRNKSGFLGVYYDSKSKRPSAAIKVEGKTKYLGSFDTEELAYEEYKKAKALYHKFQPTVNE